MQLVYTTINRIQSTMFNQIVQQFGGVGYRLTLGGSTKRKVGADLIFQNGGVRDLSAAV